MAVTQINSCVRSEDGRKEFRSFPFAFKLSRVYMKFSTAENFCICAEFFSLLKIVNSCRNREKSYLDHIEGYITINECIFVLKNYYDES